MKITKEAQSVLNDLLDGAPVPKRVRYTREQRRHHAFVLVNRLNGKFLKRSVDALRMVITRRDVELRHATLFRYAQLERIMNEVPGVDFDYKLVYKNKQGKLLIK